MPLGMPAGRSPRLVDRAYPIAVLDEAGKQRSTSSAVGGLDHAHPGQRSAARRGCPPPSPRHRDRDGRRQRRARPRASRPGMPDGVRRVGTGARSARRETRCVRFPSHCRRRRRVTSACPYSQRHRTARADPRQGPDAVVAAIGRSSTSLPRHPPGATIPGQGCDTMRRAVHPENLKQIWRTSIPISTGSPDLEFASATRDATSSRSPGLGYQRVPPNSRSVRPARQGQEEVYMVLRGSGR